MKHLLTKRANRKPYDTKTKAKLALRTTRSFGELEI